MVPPPHLRRETQVDIRKINDAVSVSPQIAPSDVAEIAAMGFKTIIANRPDGEDAGQPAFAEIAALAEANGMKAVFAPIASGAPDEATVALFAEAMAGSQGPVFAYCRTGTRCTILWSLARLEAGDAPKQVFDAARGAGYALSGLEAAFGYRPE